MKATVRISQNIDVEIDETKFTSEFMQEFRERFDNFTSLELEAHIKHLAQLYARGLTYYDFIKGYGDPEDFGIKFDEGLTDIKIVTDY